MVAVVLVKDIREKDYPCILGDMWHIDFLWGKAHRIILPKGTVLLSTDQLAHLSITSNV